MSQCPVIVPFELVEVGQIVAPREPSLEEVVVSAELLKSNDAVEALSAVLELLGKARVLAQCPRECVNTLPDDIRVFAAKSIEDFINGIVQVKQTSLVV